MPHDYEIVEGINKLVVKNTVKQYLNKDWELQGGIAVAITSEGLRIYSQALVKKAKMAKEEGKK